MVFHRRKGEKEGGEGRGEKEKEARKERKAEQGMREGGRNRGRREVFELREGPFLRIPPCHSPGLLFSPKQKLLGSRDFYFLHLGHAQGNRQEALNVEEINWSELKRSIRLASS